MHKDITYNPLQEETAKYINDDCNVVILSPTSSGKTICAEQFLFSAISAGKKAIYLSPLKALTEEKKRLWTDKHEMTVVTSDYQKPHTFSTPLILMTTESLDSKTRGNPSWLQKVGCIAVDEAHLIASDNRGDSLEVGLMRFTAINREARIILLSATIPNAQELADWLTRLNGKPTAVVSTDWRPVHQDHHLIKVGDKPWDVTKATINLVNRLSRENPEKQILIFVHTVGRGLSFAETLGCPFHYSKIPKEKKAAIEEAFRNKTIKRLVCTSTLAYGVNLPADIGVISGGTRGPTTVDPIDLKQEAGRIGRYGLSEKGDVYYVFERFHADELFDLCMKVPDVHSVLPQRLYFHIVSFVYREGMQRDDIKAFASRAFAENLDIDSHISKLQEIGALTEDENLTVTKFGKAAALMYLDPIDLIALSNNLASQPQEPEAIARAFACLPSNAVPCFIPKDIEEHLVECDYAQQSIYASCLNRWMSGEDLYGTFSVITPTLIRDIDRWIAGLKIAGLSKNYVKAISLMLTNGIPHYLIDLASQRGIGRKRAMKLYSFGIKTTAELLENPKKGIALIGKKLYINIENANSKTGKILLNF